MATKKPGAGPAGKASGTFSGKRNPFSMLTTLRERIVPLTQMLAKEGAAPEAGTIVYIHGIGNKPVASVLKCQWDSTLFGAPMGDRTRLAYWVDRDRYPEPEAATCADKDLPSATDAGTGMRAVAELAAEAEPELDAQGRRIMAALEQRLRQEGAEGTGPGAKVLPLPEGMRRWVTRLITKMFLKDVRDFFFDAVRDAVRGTAGAAFGNLTRRAGTSKA